MEKRTNKLDELLKEKYDKAKKQFETEIEKADTVDEMLHVYARYSGRLEVLIEGMIL